MRKFIKKTLTQSLRLGLSIHKNIPKSGRFRALNMAVSAVKAEANVLAKEVWDSFSVEDQLTMVHFMNTHFTSPDLDTMSFGLQFHQTVQTLQNIWITKEEVAASAAVEQHFRQSTLTRASARNTPSTLLHTLQSGNPLGWPIDYSPATTEEEALALLRTGEYRWSLVDDGTGMNTRKFGLTAGLHALHQNVRTIRKFKPHTLKLDLSINKDEVEVKIPNPLTRALHAPVPIIATIRNDNDVALATKQWDAMEATASTDDELAEMKLERDLFFANKASSESVGPDMDDKALSDLNANIDWAEINLRDAK